MENLTPTARPSVIEYETAIAGIPDSFDSLTGQQIREISKEIDRSTRGTYPLAEAQKIIRGHFDMLSTWYDAIDQLDSEIRGEVVEGGIPTDAQQYLKQQARALFAAQQILYRAVAEYHHGTAGPLLDEAYGYAYQLSNSALSPF
jgi:hypothetical protein